MLPGRAAICAKPGVELDGRDHEADRVRADDPEKIRPGRVEHGLPQPVLARQPGGDDHGCPAALGTQFRNDPRDGLGRRHYHPELRRAGQFAGIPIAAEAGNLAVFRIDGPDIALEAALDDILENHAADRALAQRSAENGNRSRAHCMFKVSDGQGVFSVCE
jgi:hypothetical protein